MANTLLSSLAFLYFFTTLLLVSGRHNPEHGFRALVELEKNNSTGQTFTHICHPKRYELLGLKMSDFLFCDQSLPYHVRAKELVNHMTITEKVLQMGNHAKGVNRLGVPKYEWWSEALHGVANTGPGTFFDSVVPGATSFPNVILTAASFNESLWRRLGEVVSTEGRAMYNLGKAGLTYWSPNVNVVRDPRWGRTLETPGEDPFVVSRYAVNYVRGLQDVEGTEDCQDLNSRPLKVSSCCKHFFAYDLDKWKLHTRWTYDAVVTEQDMVESFMRPFEACVKEGDVSSVMCSYIKVNGIPSCADPKLLNQTFRNEWGLNGYIVSDCDSVEVLVNDHKYLADTPEDGVAQTLKAGLDLDCGAFYPKSAEAAVRMGKVREEDVDRSLTFLYVVLMRLGYFDGNPKFDSLGKDDVCTKENIELAAEAARQGMVLLKNVDGTLPLKPDSCKTLAAVGPHANATDVMIGLKQYADVLYEMGCGDILCKNESLVFPAVRIAAKADATIIIVGLGLIVEREEQDREDLYLPGYQNQLIKQVADAAKGPVILVIMSAGGVDIQFAKDHPNVKAILWAGYPGEEGGRAIADVIFGKYNPGGRLPLTWYPASYADSIPMTSMKFRPIQQLGYPGRTYKFYNGTQVFPFGHGLSYTKFDHKLSSAQRSLQINLTRFQACYDLQYLEDTFRPDCPAIKLDENLSCDQTFSFQLDVTNSGSLDGDHVLIVYSKPPEGIDNTHIKQVIGFKRIFVAAGQTVKVDFEFNVCKSLQIIDYNAYRILPSGGHTIVVGEDDASFPLQLKFSFCE
ncbi:hypothetical protein K2173_021481 [Erythroxylum novogranatense]|uniref:Fibronectin type III-like domain-containing protein n=1 Tax=Erythroxylum novogranatense TaxID=1862640 RepID=A0AAV8TNI5_9ROSI|nr:hypothetical protein K2173_021481 [Erythroxylum novogranatense]